MTQLEGKIIIVTGAATGIGKGIARAFLGQGAIVVAASRNKQNLDRAAADLSSQGVTIKVMPTDVTIEEQVVGLFETVIDRFGGIDILVNNSGVMEGGSLDNTSLDVWKRVLDVNLTGVFLCSREAMKFMKMQGRGRIINIGSISAQIPRIDSVPYSTSKHGLVGLTKSIALEGRKFGIVASCLHPGNVQTESRDDSITSIGDEAMMTVEDIAEVVLAMSSLPDNVNMLESTVLPVQQPYLGRG